MGYFDPEPKRRVEDFFDMEEEIDELKRGLGASKLVVVSGLRRYGKTSLILTTLNDMGASYVFLDCRLLPSGMISASDILYILEGELSSKPWFRELAEAVEGVQVGGFGVRFRRRDYRTLVRVLESLEGRILVFDEAQELRRSRYRFDYLLAYLYDHVGVRVILSGSQVGLMYKFLRVNDPSAPLYGRPLYNVRLKPLSPDRAREFLVRGFEQEGVEPPLSAIEEALELFDGIIGWLAYFGYSYTRLGLKDPRAVLGAAARLAYEELEHALRVFAAARPRYAAVLKVVAERGEARWSEILRFVEAELGRIPRNTLSNILRNLSDMGLLSKTEGGYRIPDPVLRHAVRRYLRLTAT
ncbi:ATP-binding protein [Infirmifilum lucidum]|uniref:ATP-binding protein n=1 Tax=Infirmifilum lucidum TaxID=2776706 RepID=A0A7L9FIR0_9CREN|nr:ATP-binding protein [Infirmifilum lucidum]QOJ79242.1 ATP-binding protein [Infirmifilum lucidum]